MTKPAELVNGRDDWGSEGGTAGQRGKDCESITGVCSAMDATAAALVLLFFFISSSPGKSLLYYSSADLSDRRIPAWDRQLICVSVDNNETADNGDLLSAGGVYLPITTFYRIYT